jgi:SRSO17 transposase
VEFKTKPQIALEQLRWSHQAGLPRGVALLDAGYGNNTALGGGITALGMPYAAGICATTTVWAPGTAPLPAKKRQSARRRPGTRLRRNRKHRPFSVKALTLRQPKSVWQTISWREGTAAPLASRFACLRVRPAHRDEKLTEPRPEEWLLIEWPEGDKEPTKYWLSTCRKTSSLRRLLMLPNCAGASNATIRNSSKRSGSAISKAADGGFHHHATMCIATY